MIVFIEPGPGIAPFFHAVAEHIGKDQCAFYSTYPKSRNKLKKLGARVFPISTTQVKPGADISDYAAFEKAILNPKNIADSASESVLKTEIYNHYHKLKALFQDLKPTAIFVWNGSGLTASIAIYLAHESNINTIYGENGYFPLTMQIDPQGVNALASISGKFELDDFQKFSYTDNQQHAFHDLLNKIRNGEKFQATPATHKVNASLLSKLQQDLKSFNLQSTLKQGAAYNKKLPDNVDPLPEKYIFFPLQVRNDSQLTNHSPLFGNDTYAMIDALAKAIKAGLPDYKLVAKLHPADITKTNYDPLIAKYENISWVKKGDIQQLLRNSAAVVTVNSTVGFEGLIHHKPVILLGENFYNIPGLTHAVTDTAQLIPVLQSCIDSQPDIQKVDAALMYYYFKFFTQGHCRDYSATSIKNVADKIVSMSN